MCQIELLVEAYLAERDLVAAVDSAGGKVPLPDGRTVTVGRAEFDVLLGPRRKRAWSLFGATRRCRRGAELRLCRYPGRNASRLAIGIAISRAARRFDHAARA